MHLKDLNRTELSQPTEKDNTREKQCSDEERKTNKKGQDRENEKCINKEKTNSLSSVELKIRFVENWVKVFFLLLLLLPELSF